MAPVAPGGSQKGAKNGQKTVSKKDAEKVGKGGQNRAKNIKNGSKRGSGGFSERMSKKGTKNTDLQSPLDSKNEAPA